ncbi:uncharacterized protein LOC127730434 [Mytilus californianus]|uniref:uncharacterized protein LOC127730434 n=1 Tax=Mytilus californianus TaxID=6549 RepID=UPI0022450AEA|nr:uncharacterized protein LOC127730434 [Mytilus californianus]
MKLSVVFIFLWVESITSETVCNPSNLNTCNFSIDGNSANHLKSQFRETESLSAKIRLHFESAVKSTNDTILPTDWIMTTRGKYGGDFFTAWPVDYFLYSFGFLDSRTLSDILLNITVNPPGCDVLIGNTNTDCGITEALLTNIQIPSKESHYNHSLKWCYIKEYKGVRDTIWYTMRIYFGLPYAMFGFRCCQEDEKGISCEDEYNMKWNGYQVLPYYVGIVFFCFFPILLMKFSARAMDSGNKFKDKLNIYEDLDSDKDEWLYLQNRSPVTFSKLVLGMFGLGIKHPVTASRIRRVIFVFAAPIAIYAEILMYHFGWPELVPALVKAKIPFGFASIAGGIVDCHPLFLPMIGGPFVALLTYLMIGIIVLALPRDLGNAVEKGISSDGNGRWTLLRLHIVTIEELSLKSCVNKIGYHKVHAVLKANIFMLINPTFWQFVVNFIVKRWKQLMLRVYTAVPSNQCIQYLIFVFLLLFYVVICFTEIILCILYYGIPIFKFLTTTVNGYTMYLNRQFLDRHQVLKVFFMIFSPLCLVYYLFMSCIVISESFNFLAKIIFFVYLSIVIFPNFSFSFVYSIIMLLFFIYHIIIEIEKDYFELLHQTIKAVKHMKAEKSERKETQVTDLSESTVVIKQEMVVIGEHNSYEQDQLREKNKLPGIQRDLYEYVVRKHRPLHIAIFMTVIQICIMTFLVFASIIYVSRFVDVQETDEKHEIFHVISILLITILPNLVHRVFTPKINNKVRKHKIRQTVDNFYHMRI